MFSPPATFSQIFPYPQDSCLRWSGLKCFFFYKRVSCRPGWPLIPMATEASCDPMTSLLLHATTQLGTG